jgi:hypothetical protein
LSFADLEIGHCSSTPYLLAKTAFRVGYKLHWDDIAARFINNPRVNKYLDREYHKP